MKKLNLLVMGLLLPMLAAAQTVKSPNGNVSVTFSLTEKGQPTYEMSYKGKTVCKPSHLGLELAKDKHASKGMEETSLMDGFTETGSKTSTFDETWKPVWGALAPNISPPRYTASAPALITALHISREPAGARTSILL